MKRILFIIVTVLVVLNCEAQSHHFRFMGIPLDGDINIFNKELQNKGFKIDPNYGKELEGTFFYNGVFAGERAKLFVSYDEKTKNVYQATIIITNYTKEHATIKYQEMRDMLEEKYKNDEGVRFIENLEKERIINDDYQDSAHFEWKHVGDRNGYEQTDFIIPDIKNKDIMGLISVFVVDNFSSITYNKEYNLYIRYTDWKNDSKRRNNRMDDL